MSLFRKAWDSLPEEDRKPIVQACRDFTACLIRLARKIERNFPITKP